MFKINNQTKGAVGIILTNKKEEFLLNLRDNIPTIPHPGYWSLIGGGIEIGETELEAIQREIREEINCEVKNIKFIEKIYVQEVNVNLSIFKGNLNVKAEDIDLTEGQDIRFFKLEELKSLKIPVFLRDFIFKNAEGLFRDSNAY